MLVTEQYSFIKTLQFFRRKLSLRPRCLQFIRINFTTRLWRDQACETPEALQKILFCHLHVSTALFSSLFIFSMKFLVNFAQVFIGDVGVDLGGADGGVAKQGLDRTDVRSVLQ